MGYMSISYYLMLILTVVLYYIFPKRIRWIVLLVSSGYFYYSITENKVQLIVFGISILISYSAGIIVFSNKSRTALVIGIIGSIFPLIVSKCGELFMAFILHKSALAWIFPVGMSFYSLQIVSYLIDIYHDRVKPQKNIFKYGLFVSFFPLIIQGPVSRYGMLKDQLYEGHTYNSQKIMRGIQLIIWGFFLKFLIAEKSAVVVNFVFNNYIYYSGFFVVFAAMLYSVQLYTDFLSCTTISQGVAELFGIKLVNNFNHPYFSVSIKNFWKRWHISFSTWLRDYVYIPLGGSKKGTIRKYINIIITFFISGLWHGGYWKYIFWGLMHAGYQIFDELSAKTQNYICEKISLSQNLKTKKFIETVLTFFLVTFSWIMFRAESFKVGLKMMASMINTFNPWILFDDSLFQLGLNQKEFQILFGAILVLISISVLQEKGFVIRDWFNRQCTMIRWIIYIIAIWIIWVFGTYGYGFDASDFIYGGF